MMLKALPPPTSQPTREPDRVLGVGGPAEAEQAAAEEQVRQRAERDGRARLREPAELVVGEPDAVAGREFRPEQPVLLVDVGVVVAVGEARAATVRSSDGFSEMWVLIQQSGCFLLQLPAALHHLGRCSRRRSAA